MKTADKYTFKNTEHNHQKYLFQELAQGAELVPKLDLIFAIPNVSYGGSRQDMLRGMKLVREGKKAGVPDIFIPIPSRGYYGFFLELKKAKKRGKRGTPILGGISIDDEQKKWLKELREQGYYTKICFGKDHAKKEIYKYLKIKYN